MAKARGTFCLTLFTRANCGLCDVAKNTLRVHQGRKRFNLSEIDIMAPENKSWRDVYDFDVPVLHVQKLIPSPDNSPQKILSEATKLYHRFTEQEVDREMDRVDEMHLD